MARLRRAGWLALATAFVAGCTVSPTPSPSASDPVPTATFTPSAGAVSPSAADEPPGPVEVPTRDVMTGGTLSVMLGDESAQFAEVQCDVARGLSVVAPGPEGSGVTLLVEDGELRDLVVTMPSGRTALVGGFAGSAEFGGSEDNFRLTGRASAVAAPSGLVEEVPFTITGTCLS